MKFEISKSSRIEKVIFDNNEFYELFDELDEFDGGGVMKISDIDMIKNDYIEMGFGEDVMLFSDEDENEKNINDVVCRLDIKEGNEGYSVFFDKNKNYLIEE